MAQHRLLFVCLGNICRSPMAEGMFRHVAGAEDKLHLFEVDSAGMGDWHEGQAPDARAQQAARSRGVDISGQSARKVKVEDFDKFDLLLAMDGANYEELMEIAPKGTQHKIRYFLDYAPHVGTQHVPDPYYGGEAGFDHALGLIEAAAEGLLAELTGEKTAEAEKGA